MTRLLRGGEGDVVDVEGDELAQAQPGEKRKGDQGPVPGPASLLDGSQDAALRSRCRLAQTFITA